MNQWDNELRDYRDRRDRERSRRPAFDSFAVRYPSAKQLSLGRLCHVCNSHHHRDGQQKFVPNHFFKLHLEKQNDPRRGEG